MTPKTVDELLGQDKVSANELLETLRDHAKTDEDKKLPSSIGDLYAVLGRMEGLDEDTLEKIGEIAAEAVDQLRAAYGDEFELAGGKYRLLVDAVDKKLGVKSGSMKVQD